MAGMTSNSGVLVQFDLANHFWPLQGHTIHTSHCFDGLHSYFRLGLTHFELTVGQEMEYIDKRYRFEDTGLQITL